MKKEYRISRIIIVMLVMVAIAECIFIIIPYVQTVIVLILRKIFK